MAPGPWSLVSGRWSFVPGPGPWCLAPGLVIGLGAWRLVLGTRCLVLVCLLVWLFFCLHLLVVSCFWRLPCDELVRYREANGMPKLRIYMHHTSTLCSLDPWPLALGTWSSVPGPWSRWPPGHWPLPPWSLVIDSWPLVTGHWSLVLGPWSLVPPWPLVLGPWLPRHFIYL